MIAISVRSNTAAVLRHHRGIRREVLRASMSSALNRAAAGTETRARRFAAAKVGLTQKTIRPKLRRFRATFNRAVATIQVRLGGVRKIDTRRKPTGREFIANAPSSGRSIYKRRTAQTPRLPITEVVIAVAPALHAGVKRFLATFAPGEYQKRLAVEIKRRQRGRRVPR